jgi:hypothetical protein
VDLPVVVRGPGFHLWVPIEQRRLCERRFIRILHVRELAAEHHSSAAGIFWISDMNIASAEQLGGGEAESDERVRGSILNRYVHVGIIKVQLSCGIR